MRLELMLSTRGRRRRGGRAARRAEGCASLWISSWSSPLLSLLLLLLLLLLPVSRYLLMRLSRVGQSRWEEEEDGASRGVGSPLSLSLTTMIAMRMEEEGGGGGSSSSTAGQSHSTLKREYAHAGGEEEAEGQLEDGEEAETAEEREAAEAATAMHRHGQLEREEQEQHDHAAMLPPPPPAVLRLVVHQSSLSPSSNLLPPGQTLAVITETTSIGRDRSYDPRIRLKSLEVSKTHATLYYNDDEGVWCIVDAASTHGTFVRASDRGKGEQQPYLRLSSKGQASLPRPLFHLECIFSPSFCLHSLRKPA